MKVSDILVVRPPSLAARLKGEANRAFSEWIKEKIQSEKEQSKVEKSAERIIDLLV